MNKLPQPLVNDALALENLSNNERVESFPHLRGSVEAITTGYAQYLAVQGDALQVQNVPLSDDVKKFLKGHYGSPPADLGYIGDIRRNNRQRVCPMCGSMHRNSLDHILPKNDFTAFAVFSLNLVPACSCNVKRGTTTIGLVPGARVLHPYFDECLADRLISSQFDDLGLIPHISLRLLVDNTHPNYQAVVFHVAEIVSKSDILEYLMDSWTNLCQMPEQVIRALAEIPDTPRQLQAILMRELEMLDGHRKGKNNWDSVFVHGLLADEVLEWLFARLTAPGRGPEDPLI